MGRIRTIKPEFWRNEALSELPEFCHMLAAALLNYADDEGYFNANPRLVQAECFPLREPSMDTTVALLELSRIGFIRLGLGSDGRSYGHIVHFLKHQTINKASKSKIAVLSIAWPDSGNTTVELLHCYSTEQGTGNGEQGREQGTGNGEISEAKASGADAPQGDPEEMMMSTGIAMLTKAGHPKLAASKIIGKWKKANGVEAVIAAIGRAHRECAAEPVSFIEGVLKFGAKRAKARTPEYGDTRERNGQTEVYHPFDGWRVQH